MKGPKMIVLKKKKFQELSLLVISATIILAFGSAIAEPNPHRDVNKDSQGLKKYLKEKYIHVSEVRATKKNVPLGQIKKVVITGAMKPKSKIKGKGKKQRAQAVAKSFILDEPSIFGISIADELTEQSAEVNANGYTNIKYRREVQGIPLEGMEILLAVGPDEKITYVATDIVQTPPELYQAIKMSTIAREKAIDIIKHDLTSEIENLGKVQILKINKIAISSSPWVAWKADVNMYGGEPGRWFYWIDAFDGGVISKKFILQSLREINR
jgi:Zn-dependent metalloprotease